MEDDEDEEGAATPKYENICMAIMARDVEEAKERIAGFYDNKEINTAATIEWRLHLEREPNWLPFNDRFPRPDWLLGWSGVQLDKGILAKKSTAVAQTVEFECKSDGKKSSGGGNATASQGGTGIGSSSTVSSGARQIEAETKAKAKVKAKVKVNASAAAVDAAAATDDKEQEARKKLYLYTDGSCLKNPGGHCGVGIVVMVKDIKTNDQVIISRIGGYIGNGDGFTNNVAELSAIDVALREAIRLARLPDCPFDVNSPCKVLTDSDYCIGQLDRDNKTNKNKKLIGRIKDRLEYWNEAIHPESSTGKTEFVWVKGHARNKYNIICDKLAGDAAHSQEWTIECFGVTVDKDGLEKVRKLFTAEE
jgi:ribonuclease HI